MTSPPKTFVLTLTCPGGPGLVADVSGLIFNSGGNILEAQQFDDLETGLFFMRLQLAIEAASLSAFNTQFEALAARRKMEWRLRPETEARRVAILVSKTDHCLADLLYRQRIGDLNMSVAAIISNHPLSAMHPATIADLPFHHVSITPETKPAGEREILDIIADSGAELVVLARYMQVLSADMARALHGRCINIHHGLLPAFKGARPYHQAFTRGVKLVGATAHYVTEHLDEGPIIAQAVEPASHVDTAASLARKGRDVERLVLARAVHLHLQDRVFLNGQKTVVFAD